MSVEDDDYDNDDNDDKENNNKDNRYEDQYVVFAHWMLYCPVSYVERRGPYLPWQS